MLWERDVKAVWVKSVDSREGSKGQGRPRAGLLSCDLGRLFIPGQGGAVYSCPMHAVPRIHVFVCSYMHAFMSIPYVP